MLRLITTATTLLVFTTTLLAQVPIWSAGFDGPDFDHGYDVTTDVNGNVLIAGSFLNAIDFDPGPGTAPDNSQTNIWANGFVVKLDANSNYQWHAPFYCDDLGECTSVVADTAGNVYVSGVFREVVDLDPGAAVVLDTSESNGCNFFIVKLDAAGNYVWSSSFHSNRNGEIVELAIDGSNNLVAFGKFDGTLDFDPGPGVANLTVSEKAAFVLKLDLNGQYVDVMHFNSQWEDVSAERMTIDDQDNIYLTGTFLDQTDFDPSASTTFLTPANGTRDTYIVKLNDLGQLVWVKAFPSVGGSDAATGIAVDQAGNVYTTGQMGGMVDFDPGAGTANLSPSGFANTWIAKLNSNGNYEWAHNFGSIGGNGGRDIATDAAGNVFTYLWVNGVTVDFDPGPDSAMHTAVGIDPLLLQLDSNGDYLWSGILTGPNTDWPTRMHMGAQNTIYGTGDYNNSIDFDPGPGTHILNSFGSQNGFVFKLSTCATVATDTVVAYNAHTWIDGQTYTTDTSSITHSLVNAAGCDSVVTLHLTVIDTCVPPTNLLAKFVNDTTALLTWDTLAGAQAYRILYKPVGTSGWSILPRNGNYGQKDVSGLLPGTLYRWRVQTNCGAGWTSPSPPDFFKTLVAPCSPPDSLAAQLYAGLKVRLTWNAQPTAVKYKLRWREQGGQWNYKLKDGSKDRHWLLNLTPSGTYEWQIKTWCEAYSGTGTQWSAVYQFTALSAKTTAPIASAAETALDLSIFPNPTRGIANVVVPNLQGELTLTVVNILGETMLQQQVTAATVVQVELAGAAPGTYFVQLVGAQQQAYERLIVH